MKTKIIKSGKLDMYGLKKIGKSFLLTMAAAAIGFVASTTGTIDYGSADTIVATLLPFLANFLYKLLGNYEVNV